MKMFFKHLYYYLSGSITLAESHIVYNELYIIDPQAGNTIERRNKNVVSQRKSRYNVIRAEFVRSFESAFGEYSKKGLSAQVKSLGAKK